MQGAVACPFYSVYVSQLRALASIPTIGIGDSLLMYLRALHLGSNPPFQTLRVQPLSQVPSWRSRVLSLSFVRDWHGRRDWDVIEFIHVAVCINILHGTSSEEMLKGCFVGVTVHPRLQMRIELRRQTKLHA